MNQSPKFTAPRGTQDILPEEIHYWQHIEHACEKIFAQYGISEIRTPIFESTELFARGVGDDTDIVSKEMYTFNDRKNRSMTLRPEGTASIVRAYLESEMSHRPGLTKLWYRGPMFRYERPQAGRYRQFHQIGVEYLGADTPLCDAEMIGLTAHLFSHLGLSDIEIKINSVGDSVCRPVIRERIKYFLGNNLKYLCSDCQTRFEKNPLRILDCKNPKCQSYFAGMPDLTSTLCQPCQDHLNSVMNYLTEMKIDFKVDTRLVRGLDYYQRTVFELVSNKLGAQNALCGGGRYDNLVQELGGNPTPAVGFAFGLERAVAILKEQKLKMQNLCDQNLLIVTLGEPARHKGMAFVHELRLEGLCAQINLGASENLKNIMKKANDGGFQYVLIIGDTEIEKKAAVLKEMESGKQTQIKFSHLIPTILKQIKKVN